VATDTTQQNRVSEVFLHGEDRETPVLLTLSKRTGASAVSIPTFQTTCDAWSEQDTGENGEYKSNRSPVQAGLNAGDRLPPYRSVIKKSISSDSPDDMSAGSAF